VEKGNDNGIGCVMGTLGCVLCFMLIPVDDRGVEKGDDGVVYPIGAEFNK
jgi:hypothetical protein